ncbi:3'(2'),5'-bisphosphate nucleotidase CysQ [Aliiroseovarius subalbicans]|uniref:inositol monophosphatase family protein n=1 Tax=Aliiroseovarius subalbicans TaxID=2925840 RepID=UPI001F5AEFEC|nr:3'(2'),5'-bisphosphate nucleotidase CysQ [Aliiroseovarius subalbicans]MCI2400168.1 3'(2'),5'-bisphosphate nucleotidase CysQ [Aliiroseovarius subalbicans]
MPARDDLQLLIDAARESGRIARHFFENAHEIWEKADGQGPVTEADIAVDRLLRTDLRAARPGYGWLSEETEDDLDRLKADRVFIVDPIDGTRAFIEGSPTWAHSLAVVDRGQVTAAVVYLPMTDRLFAATKGQGATLNGEAITASPRDDLGGASVLAARPAFEPWHWKDALVPPVKRNFRSSLAYRMALVGQGRFDAMLTLRATWEWDIAAGALIVEEAGGRVTDKTGAALCFNNEVPQLPGVVAGGAQIHPALVTRLA